MKYKVMGGNLPAVICSLEAGQEIICEKGAMSWMDDVFTMETKGGGFSKMFGRAFSGETMFQNIYTANSAGEIAFASSFPGDILAIQVTPDRPVIAQKSAFLACDPTVETSVFFNKKLGAGFFSGEGFVMQKFSGNGIVLLEVDGSTQEYVLAPGEKKIMETGHLVIMDASCSLDIVSVKGLKNKLLGGEGFFNTVVTGPGKIVLQTMPISKTAELIASLIPSSGN